MIILGIETSCDETSVAIIEAKRGKFSVRSNIVSSQIETHAKYGGVVPEVAARKHAENFMGVFDLALEEAKVKEKEIDLLACVKGPGLITSLLVGLASARTIAWALGKPFIPVNHLKAHIYANFLLTPPLIRFFPALCLVVSGGHTELVLMRGIERFKKIGETKDDAAGECFDKVAKMLGLPYPGGPKVAQLASMGNPQAHTFPRPMLTQDNFDFSFAGLKTSVLYFLRDLNMTGPRRSLCALRSLSEGGEKERKFMTDICASVQQAILDCLIGKTLRAVKAYHVKTVLLAGGVAANIALRQQLQERIRAEFPDVLFIKPLLSYCTDNAAMVAAAGYFQYVTSKKKRIFEKTWRTAKADPNFDIN
jgi:N6-L-threonylcarbamoyladenine synthase